MRVLTTLICAAMLAFVCSLGANGAAAAAPKAKKGTQQAAERGPACVAAKEPKKAGRGRRKLSRAARRAAARRAAAARKRCEPKRPASPPRPPAPAQPTTPAQPPAPATPSPPAQPVQPAPAPAPAPPPAPPPAEPAPAPPAEPDPLDPNSAIGPRDVVTPFPTGMRLFAPDSFWNAPLAANAPLAPESAGLAAALAGEVQREKDSRIGPWINLERYSVPVYTVGADVPKVRVIADEPFPQFVSDLEAVPMPANAHAADGDDRHLAIYQPSSDTLWEFWLARKEADGWHARWGGKMTNVSKNPGYFPNPMGATATSLPLLGGLITARELEAGRIDHALALAIPNTAAGRFTWPAQRGDGRTTGPTAIPQGTHFRIDPSVNLDRLGLSRVGLTIARAAQRYGIVLRDTAGAVVFFAEDPTTASRDPYPTTFTGHYPNQLLEGFPWDKLQVVAPRGG